MQSTLAKAKPDHLAAQNGKNLGKVVSVSPRAVDFSIFGAKEIRDILKSKAHCLQAGFSTNHVIIKTLNEIRNHYVQRVGLATYLSQMLGPLGNVPIKNCTLYAEKGHRIELQLNGNYNQPVQRFIAKQFQWNNLPVKIEARRESKPDHIEIRYL